MIAHLSSCRRPSAATAEEVNHREEEMKGKPTPTMQQSASRPSTKMCSHMCVSASNLEFCHDLVPFILLFSGNRSKDRGRSRRLLGLWGNFVGLGMGSGGGSGAILFTLLQK